jgi:hypothetical protein
MKTFSKSTFLHLILPEILLTEEPNPKQKFTFKKAEKIVERSWRISFWLSASETFWLAQKTRALLSMLLY